MAAILKIKRSEVAGNPTTLAAGELAYSGLGDNGSNGGDRLYIGMGTETNGDAANHVVVGGKFFTDMLDHTKGTLTASSAIIVDSNSKIDNLKVDNLDFNGNTISSTDTNGNITITPDGSGKIVLDGQNWPNAVGTNGYYLKTDNSGVLEWAAIPSGSFTITGNTGSDAFTTGETLTVTGSGAISTSVSDNTITISAADATTSAKGIASFNSTYFSVSSGAVSIQDEYVQDTVGAMVSSNSETNISVTYDDTNGKLDFSVPEATSSVKGVASFDVNHFTVTSGAVTINDEHIQDTVGAMVSTNSETNISVTYDDTNGKLDFSVADATTSVKGVASFASADFNVSSGAVTINNVNLGTQTTGNYVATVSVTDNTGLSITGSAGEGSTITLAGVDATTTVKGVASFSSTYFDVTSGAVSLKSGSISNTQLANSSVTIGTTSISLGATSTTLAGLTQFDVDNIRIDGNTISSTDTNGNIAINPNGTGIVTVGTSMTITGDLTVNGTTTTVNSTTLTVDDKNIELGSTASPTDASADGGGITLKGTTDKTFNWVDATDSWTSSEHLNLLTGKEYKINGTSVLSANTLGSGVTASSLTTVGTLTSGSLGTGFTAVAVPQGGTGVATLTDRGVIFGNGVNAVGVTAGSSIDGSFLREDSTGNPYWSNVIDGGTY